MVEASPGAFGFLAVNARIKRDSATTASGPSSEAAVDHAGKHVMASVTNIKYKSKKNMHKLCGMTRAAFRNPRTLVTEAP